MALNLLSPVANVHRRDYPVSDSGMVDPDDSSHLQAGEWVELTSDGEIQEGLSASTYPQGGEGPFYQVFSQRGDTAAQALGKMTVIMSYDYEFETDMYADATYTVGQQLTLTLGDTGGGGTGDDTRNILAAPGAVTDIIVAVVTMPPTGTNSGLLRCQRVNYAVVATP